MTFDPMNDVSTHVSPTLHPKALSRFSDVLDATDTPGQPFFKLLNKELANSAVVFHALGSALNDLYDIEQGERKVRRHQRMDGPDEFFGDLRMINGKLKVYDTIYDEYADTSDDLMKDVASGMQFVQKNYEGTVSQFENRINAEVFRGAKPHAEQSELRAFLLGNFDQPIKRFGFIRTQMKEHNDLSLVQAVLAKPPYLTGLDERSMDVLRLEAAQRYAFAHQSQHSILVNEIEGVMIAWQEQIRKRNEVAGNMRANAKVQVKKKINSLKKLKKRK